MFVQKTREDNVYGVVAAFLVLSLIGSWTDDQIVELSTSSAGLDTVLNNDCLVFGKKLVFDSKWVF